MGMIFWLLDQMMQHGSHPRMWELFLILIKEGTLVIVSPGKSPWLALSPDHDKEHVQHETMWMIVTYILDKFVLWMFFFTSIDQIGSAEDFFMIYAPVLEVWHNSLLVGLVF